MKNLSAIKPTYKSGNEKLLLNGENLNHTLRDFWRWSTSDILSNATRGKFAEFIVATALGIDITTPSNEWSAYDLVTERGTTIQVKSSAYVQAWYQKKYSKPIFSIAKAKHWNAETGMTDADPNRHADVYIFCLLKEKDQLKIDPMDMNQWKFYVIKTKDLNNYKRSQHSITLPSLQKIAKLVTYERISDWILAYEAPKATFTEPVILLNINKLYKHNMTQDELYNATRRAWRIGPRASDVNIACAVYGGIIKEVYNVDMWHTCPDVPGRMMFDGAITPKEIREKYINKSVTHLWKQGSQNPIKYVGKVKPQSTV